MPPNLREQMLMQGQVDGVFGLRQHHPLLRQAGWASLTASALHQLRRLGMDLIPMHHFSKKCEENPKASRVSPCNQSGPIDSLKDIDASVVPSQA